MTFEREYAGGRVGVSPVSGARGADELPVCRRQVGSLGWHAGNENGANREIRPVSLPNRPRDYCTAFIMSKIGRYIAITMPPTITPRITIMAGSMRERSALTATSTSSS